MPAKLRQFIPGGSSNPPTHDNTHSAYAVPTGSQSLQFRVSHVAPAMTTGFPPHDQQLGYVTSQPARKRQRTLSSTNVADRALPPTLNDVARHYNRPSTKFTSKRPPYTSMRGGPTPARCGTTSTGHRSRPMRRMFTPRYKPGQFCINLKNVICS